MQMTYHYSLYVIFVDETMKPNQIVTGFSMITLSNPSCLTVGFKPFSYTFVTYIVL